MRAQFESDAPVEVHRSHEYGSLIIHSIETDQPRVVYGNVPNRGLIDDLPPGCCVEVPCLVDRNGVQPTKIGPLPPQLAALMQTNINVQSLAAEVSLSGRRQSPTRRSLRRAWRRWPGPYELALASDLAPVMQARVAGREAPVNRMLAPTHDAADLLNKLEAVRVLCQETGCAQRYLAHDALNALAQVSARLDDAKGTTEHRARFDAYLAHVQDQDLALGIAMTDAKGDRSRKPHQQANPDSYVHVVERNARGIVISGTKAIVTGRR